MFKGHVTGVQLRWLLSTMMFGNAVLMSFSSILQAANQDAWIAALLGGAITFYTAFVSIKISMYFPDQSFVEYSQILFGKWFGKLLTLPYLIMFLSVAPVVYRQGSDFISTTLLQETPVWAVVGLFCLIVFYLASGGIDGIARCCEITGPLIFVLLILFLVLLLPDADYHQLLPVYVDTGAFHILQASRYMAGYLGESVVLILIVPFLDRKHIYRESFRSLAISLLFLTVFLVFVLMVFGPNLSKQMWYPAYGAVRIISLGGFLERIDPIAVIIWLYCVLIKLAVYSFAMSYSLSQWLNIKNWRRLLWVVVLIGGVCSVLPRNIVNVNVQFGELYWYRFILPINMLLLPTFVWIVAALRKPGNE